MQESEMNGVETYGYVIDGKGHVRYLPLEPNWATPKIGPLLEPLPRYGYRFVGEANGRRARGWIDLSRWEIIENSSGTAIESGLPFDLCIRRCGTMNRWRLGDAPR